MSDRAMFRAGFRKRSYPDGEVRALRESIGREFDTDLRGVELPEAGGSTELWAILQTPLGWVASGVVGSAAYDSLKLLTGRLSKWWRQYQRRNVHGMAPELESFGLELGEILVRFTDGRRDESPDIYFMTSRHLEVLSEALAYVLSCFPLDALMASNIVRVTVPIFVEHTTKSGWFASRYWPARNSAGADLLLDSLQGTVGPAPSAPLLPADRDSHESG